MTKRRLWTVVRSMMLPRHEFPHPRFIAERSGDCTAARALVDKQLEAASLQQLTGDHVLQHLYQVLNYSSVPQHLLNDLRVELERLVKNAIADQKKADELHRQRERERLELVKQVKDWAHALSYAYVKGLPAPPGPDRGKWPTWRDVPQAWVLDRTPEQLLAESYPANAGPVHQFSCVYFPEPI